MGIDRWGWTPYVPVAERRRKAQREMEKRRKKGDVISPVVIQGRAIASTFWGKSWCENLERYSDYANRLPRGRTYVRNGSVVDLCIERGLIRAMVSGSSLYRVEVTIAPVAQSRWKSICVDCAGAIDSLVELLQGRFSKGVMERICRKSEGLFPAPAEIKLACSCPDGAYMCKHVAATLYGVGARLDAKPELLFRMRGVDEGELIAKVGKAMPLAAAAPTAANILDGDLGAIFGLDLDARAIAPLPEPAKKAAAKSVVKKAAKKAVEKSGKKAATKAPAKKRR